MSEEKKEKVKGGSKKIIIFALVGILLLGGGGFAGYYFIFGKKAKTPESGIPVAGQVQPAVQGAIQNVVPPKLHVEFDEFITNLADESGKKYIKVKVSIGYDNKKLAKEFEDKKQVVRDIINSVLRSKKSTDLTTKGVDDLKVEILNRVNPILENGRALNIYFSDIVIQ